MSKDFINIKNRKASHEYEFIDKYVAGIMLKGTEIKSIRNSQVTMSDAHCVFFENELWIKNLHISEYGNGGYTNHEPKRERKLLLNKQELEKINGKVTTKGMTIIPTRLFINDKGRAVRALNYATLFLKDANFKSLYKMKPEQVGLGHAILKIEDCK